MKKFRHYTLLLVTVMTVFGCSKDNDDTESNQDIRVESVALAGQSVVKGGTVKLEPAFTPATATNKSVTWTSSKPEVATIAADGTVTGVTEGETTITVTTEDGGFTATCKVIVQKVSIFIPYKLYDKSENTEVWLMSCAYYENKVDKAFVDSEIAKAGSGYRIPTKWEYENEICVTEKDPLGDEWKNDRPTVAEVGDMFGTAIIASNGIVSLPNTGTWFKSAYIMLVQERTK